MTVIDILVEHRGVSIGVVGLPRQLCLVIWTTGIIAGTALGAAGAKWPWAIGVPSYAVSFGLNGAPVLVFLFWLHYPFQMMLAW